jgi:hypothetical protein
LLLCPTGCGVALMQTARPVAHGKVDVTVGSGFLYNDMILERGVAPENLPQHFGLRYGAGDRWDLGGALYLGSGALLDAKVNLLPPERATALSLYGGLGGAMSWGLVDGPTGGLVHLPLRALASHRLPGGRLTPYAGLGWGACWVLGYDPEASHTWHGDGLLLANAGLQLGRDEAPVRVLLEYDLLQPVLDDQGDGHAFATNHTAMVGLVF